MHEWLHPSWQRSGLNNLTWVNVDFFLDPPASLDLKLSVSEWVIHLFQFFLRLAHLPVSQSYYLYEASWLGRYYHWDCLLFQSWINMANTWSQALMAPLQTFGLAS